VALGAAPWVLAPFVALAAGRDVLAKTRQAREVAQKKLEEERIAELSRKKTSEPLSFELSDSQKTVFAASLAALAVGFGGILFQAATAPYVAPAPTPIKAAPKPVTLKEKITAAEKVVEKDVLKAEEKLGLKAPEPVKAPEPSQTNLQKLIETVEKEAVVAEKVIKKEVAVVEKEVSVVEKAVEKEVKVLEKAVEKAVEKEVAVVEKVKAPQAPPTTVSGAETIDPALLQALKAGKYRTK
jgi:hypothetical protein